MPFLGDINLYNSAPCIQSELLPGLNAQTQTDKRASVTKTKTKTYLTPTFPSILVETALQQQHLDGDVKRPDTDARNLI